MKEGTGVYWQAPFAALEAAGIEVILVHARQVKQLSDRKTDVADGVWLACVCQFGLCTPSHVSPEPFREHGAKSRKPETGTGTTARNREDRSHGGLAMLERYPINLDQRAYDLYLT